jgi:glycosyltransferase involved in cell wall biosynthesis
MEPSTDSTGDGTAGRLRVVFFDAFPHTWGGAQAATHLLAIELAKRSLATAVVTTGHGPFVDRLQSDGIETTVLHLPRALQHYGHTTRGRRALAAMMALPPVWLRLSRQLRRTADVLHVNDYRGMLLAGPAARLAGIPIIWHLHASVVESSRVLNRICSVLADRMVVAAPGVIRRLPGRSRRTPIDVVPCAVSQAVLDGPLATPADDPLVVTAARCSPEKGLDVLLLAVATARLAVPDLRAVIYGACQSGYEWHLQDLQRLRGELGLDDAVEFAGHVELPHRYWATACCYAQPSRLESFGLAALEAMAMGLPVVAARVGGLAELVEDNVTGFLVEPEDPGALASAIVKLVANRSLATEMGQAGRAVALDGYTPDSFADRVAALYPRPRVGQHALAR